MRDLPIAYGDSCFAVHWSNKTISLDDLADRLAVPIRTTETVSEYAKMKKAERDRAKDKGGFVGGHLKGGRRKRENVVSRSMLTLDLDQAKPEFLSGFLASCHYAALVYSTHSHTPEAPRLRVIIPLTRDVSPDEYQAIGRYFADSWGIDQFDECSYRPHQLMYWPTVPANGEYIFEQIDRDWLDPDEYLARHPNWRDCALLPTSSDHRISRLCLRSDGLSQSLGFHRIRQHARRADLRRPLDLQPPRQGSCLRDAAQRFRRGPCPYVRR